MGKKGKQRKLPDGKNVKKHVFQVDSVNFTLDRNKTKLLLGFKSAIPITPDYYELLKQNIEVQACSPPRNMEDKDDELSAAFTGATHTWIDNLAEREIYKGKELNRQLGFYDYDYDSRPRATLSQDKLFNGESPSVGNIKTHPGIYPPRQEKPVSEPTRKEVKVKPKTTVIGQHCQEPITKQIKRLLLQKHKGKAQRTRKSHTWQKTKPSLGKDGRTVASETPQVKKKKQPPCFTGVLTSEGKTSCLQRKKGTESDKSVPEKVQKMGYSTPVIPSQESEEIWDLDKALEFIEGAPLSNKKLADESGEKEPMIAQSEVAVITRASNVQQQDKHGDLDTQNYQDSPAVSTALVSNCLLYIFTQDMISVMKL